MEKTRVTVEEFLKLPETSEKVELIDGEIIVSPAPVHKHQIVEGFMYVYLFSITRGKWLLAEMDVHIGGVVVNPDIFWVRRDSTTCVLKDDGYWHGAPDLVVEILSPSTAHRDRGEKYDLYEQYGVREYWLVDAEALIVEVYVREGDKFARRGVFGVGQTFASAALGVPIDIGAMLGELV
jgi:Uma2 family endonuclease